MRFPRLIIPIIVMTFSACGKKESNEPVTGPGMKPYSTQKIDRGGYDKWKSVGSSRYGFTIDLPHFAINENAEWFDNVEYKAVGKSCKYSTDFTPADKIAQAPQYAFRVYAVTYKPGASDRDKVATRTKIFEHVRNANHIEDVKPSPVTWAGTAAEVMDCDAFSPGKKAKYRTTIRRLETETGYYVAVLLDGGEFPQQAKDWFFNSFKLEPIVNW